MSYHKIVIDENKKFENTDKFRKAAIHFGEHGCYTFAPRGTTSYREYWDEEIKRCLYGYSSEDGDHITGYNYFYLNYCQILLVDEKEITDSKGRIVKRVVKEKNFPRFYDYDKFFFDAVEECELQGKHLVVLKARRKGYSFKIASMLCRNFYLIPNSKSFALASGINYLIKDGILSKAWEFMDFIDENTALSKKRDKIDTKLHKRASFIIDVNGTNVEMGYKSEIIGVTLNNDPDKARGISGKLIVFEEAGKLPGLKEAWQICKLSVEQGTNVHGTMICFGTGGEEGADFEGLRELFEEPDVYNCLEFKNIWDEEAPVDESCGFFVPAYANLDGVDSEGNSFMDDQGNTIKHITKRHLIKNRDKIIKNASDKNTIDRHVAELPIIPAEATLNISSNIFPKKELIRHLAYIRNNKKVKDFKQVGELNFDSSGVIRWEPMAKPIDITRYRLGANDNKKGAIVIWEHPIESPPYGLYIMGVDPYDHDVSSGDSLGSTLVYKRFQNFESYHDIIVAEYTGRPDTADEYYENVRKLAMYYNATIMYENEKKGLFTYFANKHCEYILADQPDKVLSDIIKDTKVQRRKGCHMNIQIKGYGEIQIKDWLNEEFAPGQKNLTQIFSEALLEELVAYNPDGNFDRVMALMQVMIYKKELHNIQVKKREESAKSRLLFDSPLDFNKGNEEDYADYFNNSNYVTFLNW
jgi:hypothetical protein